MVLMRVGLVPSTGHKDTTRLHRAALVISRSATTLPRYGRAALGSLADPAGVHRLAQVGAGGVWGMDSAVASTLLRHTAALVLVVLKAKPRKDSAVAAAVERLLAAGHTVQVHTIGVKGGVIALDIAPGRTVHPVDDLTLAPSARTHSAPYLERPPVPPRALTGRAPSLPRPAPAPPASAAPAPAAAPPAPPAAAAPPTGKE